MFRGLQRKALSISIFFSVTLSSAEPYELFSASYSLLSTIAGQGGSGDGNINNWKKTFEGKKATDAVLSGPHFAMADSAGNVYIADKDAHAIRKVSPDGIITTVAGTSSAGDGNDGRAAEQALDSPNGLWVSKKGVLYILDLGNNKIRKVDTTGTMTTLFEDTAGIAVGRGLWVSSSEDTVWYSSGSTIKQWTKQDGPVPFADGFSALGNIMQDQNGLIVATDRSTNLVYRISSTGVKTIIAGNGTTSGGGNGFTALETAFYGVRGIWVLDNGSYFLATHEGSRVWYIDTAGIAHLFVNGKEGDDYHSGDGEDYRTPGDKISEVRSVTVDHQGNVLITENDRGYIRKVGRIDLTHVVRKGQRQRLSVSMIHPSAQTAGIRVLTRSANPSAPVFYNAAGCRCPFPLLCSKKEGGFEFIWERSDVTNGIYFYHIDHDGTRFTGKWSGVW